MNGLISRRSVIEAVRVMQTYKLSEGDDMLLVDQAEVMTELMMLPSAEPVRKKGWWVPITESDCSGYDPVLAGYEDPVVGYVCSVCGDGQEKEVMGEPLWNFCPNCGARMSEGEEDE